MPVFSWQTVPHAHNSLSEKIFMRVDVALVTSDRERAELLNKYFGSVCLREDDNNPPLKRAACVAVTQSIQLYLALAM